MHLACIEFDTYTIYVFTYFFFILSNKPRVGAGVRLTLATRCCSKTFGWAMEVLRRSFCTLVRYWPGCLHDTSCVLRVSNGRTRRVRKNRWQPDIKRPLGLDASVVDRALLYFPLPTFATNFCCADTTERERLSAEPTATTRLQCWNTQVRLFQPGA